MNGAKTYQELLSELKSFSGEFAEREAVRRKDFRLTAGQLRRDHQSELETLEETAHQDSLDLEARLLQHREARLARSTQLKDRAEALVRNTRKELALDEERDNARIQHQIQRSMLDHTRQKDQEIHDAETLRKELEEKLDENEEELETLEALVSTAIQGFGKFKKERTTAEPKEDIQGSNIELTDKHSSLVTRVTEGLQELDKKAILKIFKEVPLFVFIIIFAALHGGTPFVTEIFKLPEISTPILGASFAAFSALFIGLYVTGRSKNQELVSSISIDFSTAPVLKEKTLAIIESTHEETLKRIEQEREDGNNELKNQWKLAKEEAAEARRLREEVLTSKDERIKKRWASHHEFTIKQLDESEASLRKDHEADAANNKTSATERFESERKRLEDDQANDLEVIQNEWKKRIAPISSQFTETTSTITEHFPTISKDTLDGWDAPNSFKEFVPFAEAHIDLRILTGAIDEESVLTFPEGRHFKLPLALVNPEEGSLLIESKNAGGKEIAEILNRTMLNILLSSPPGRLTFTIIDPVGLGENFAGIMHLSDYEESLINNKIWTQTSQIEQRLAEINEHIEKVIQMYLRDEYASIKEYNEKAGTIAERYHYIVISGYPHSFSDLAAKRLQSIINSGPRCGVYTLIHCDHQHPKPPTDILESLRESSCSVTWEKDRFLITPELNAGADVHPLTPIDPEIRNALIHKVGKASVDSTRVEVPFGQIAPEESELWSVRTDKQLRVPIGRTGATKLQYLSIGKGTCQHALIAGKTGSGKSTLFHIIVTNLALWCSPDDVEFYLIDFKKGVEFKAYAKHKLPHARVIAIESDREFGLSVLQRLDEELKRRGDLFRELGVQDVAGYVKAGGKEPMPRTILLIDEFQEFFIEDDRTSQNAALLLDRIVRQGRAFGVHAILGSQTLGGAFTLARSTLGQMAIRIALQCNEADAMLIMDDNNPAPRMLSRPGEGIYNDDAGRLEGNNPFQVVWLSEEERDARLEAIRTKTESDTRNWSAPIIFEGNIPAAIDENQQLKELLATPLTQTQPIAHAYLGAPNSIKAPTSAAFMRQSGNHLLAVGQNEDDTLAIIASSTLALSVAHPRDHAQIFIIDATTNESLHRDYLSELSKLLPQETKFAHPGNAGELIQEAAKELEARKDGGQGNGKEIYVIIHGIHRVKKLKQEEEFSFSLDDDESGESTGKLFKTLINEGSSVGIHFLLTCDSVNNLNRILNRKLLSEIEMKVVFQMSATDSASLIDSPKAGSLGQNRALYYNEAKGHLETFRPYLLPSDRWIKEQLS